MPRRVVRIAPVMRGLNPIRQSISRTASQRNVGYGNSRINVIPQQSYTRPVSTAIQGGYASDVMSAGGRALAFCGPQGVGTVWYPQSVAIATSSGAIDSSTCAVFLTSVPNPHEIFFTSPTQQIGGQSYAGGGDTIGLSVPPIYPGLFVVALWDQGVSGDLATMQVYGFQTVLST